MQELQSGWQALQTRSRPKCPKLFYRFKADGEGYELQFTDLIALWEAKASSDDVRDYARITRASIDPSGSKSQLKVLFEKLAQSLAKGSNDLRQDEDSHAEALLLSTALSLPRPLQPLKWQFYLEPKGAGGIAESILKPCLHQAAEGMKMVESLIEMLAAKDRALSRLLDKIEGSSIDLSLIFPGITGVRARKGQVTLKEAQRHVPGLAEFKREEWLKFFESDSPYAGFESSGLSKLVDGNEKCPKHTPQQHERWLQKLPKASATTSQVAKLELNRSSSPVNQDTDSENEFETQKKPTTAGEHEVKDATNTESEDERMATNAKQSPMKARPRPLGGIRSKASRSSSSELPSSPPAIADTVHNKNKARDSSESSSEDSDLDAAPKPKARLGKLGIKSGLKSPGKPLPARSAAASHSHASSSPSPTKPQAASPTSSPPPDPPLLTTALKAQKRVKSSSSTVGPDTDPISQQPTTPRKLGKLGGTRKRTDSPSPAPSPEPRPGDTGRESKPPSTQTTPSKHRLGRLGRIGASQSQAQSQNEIPEPEDMDLDDNKKNDDNANDSDASTASTASATSPPVSKHGRTSQKRPKSASSVSETPEPTSKKEPTPEPEEELSKEEKAAQRREELKRKIGAVPPASNAGGAGGAAGGLRKKRKF